MVTIRETRKKDIKKLIKNGMRAIDQMECKAFGNSPREALRLGFEKSEFCYTVIYEGKVIGMFGVIRDGMLSSSGTAWFLGTKDTLSKKHAIDWVRQARKYIQLFMTKFSMLHNMVSIDNQASKKWLASLGFEVSEEVYYAGKYGGFNPFQLGG